VHKEAIESDIKSGVSLNIISRKIFLSYPTAIFHENYDVEFEIKDRIAETFKIPFTSIHIVGSAKTGYSFWKNREFLEKESDLDIAIISSQLFTKMLDYAYTITKGYTDNRNFQEKKHEISYLDRLP